MTKKLFVGAERSLCLGFYGTVLIASPTPQTTVPASGTIINPKQVTHNGTRADVVPTKINYTTVYNELLSRL